MARRGASIVAPGHKQVLPLPPEFIAPQDGAEKQDCERNAAKRWLAKHGDAVAHLRPVFLGDDLFACQPIVAAIHEADGNFILTCKQSSHKTIAEYLQCAELQEHRDTVCKRGKPTTTVYRWLSAVPLRASDDAITVNWFSIATFNAKGKRTYYNSFVTDLAITSGTVAELAACGRARWKIENETFNVLKNNGYNLEHNFGHGKKTLASVLVTLNLLAFAFHTAAYLGVLAWRTAVVARGPTYRFFEHLRTITAYVSSRTGHTCSSPSPRRLYGHLDQRPPPSRIQPTLDTETKHQKYQRNPNLESLGRSDGRRFPAASVSSHAGCSRLYRALRAGRAAPRPAPVAAHNDERPDAQ
jgi:Transposase DDE domain